MESKVETAGDSKSLRGAGLLGTVAERSLRWKPAFFPRMSLGLPELQRECSWGSERIIHGGGTSKREASREKTACFSDNFLSWGPEQ